MEDIKSYFISIDARMPKLTKDYFLLRSGDALSGIEASLLEEPLFFAAI